MTWYSLWLRAAFLAMEAQQVMWLRMMRLGAGGRMAEREAVRMISEKVAAAGAAGIDAAGAAARGMGAAAITGKTISGYRRRVRSNRKRLNRRRT